MDYCRMKFQTDLVFRVPSSLCIFQQKENVLVK